VPARLWNRSNLAIWVQMNNAITSANARRAVSFRVPKPSRRNVFDETLQIDRYSSQARAGQMAVVGRNGARRGQLSIS